MLDLHHSLHTPAIKGIIYDWSASCRQCIIVYFYVYCAGKSATTQQNQLITEQRNMSHSSN